MARQNISKGTAANDGTGDTLRSAATKINENFTELYTALGGDSTVLGNGITFDNTGIIFTDDSNHTTTLGFLNPDAAGRTINLPNKDGEIVTIESDGARKVVDLADGATAARALFNNNYDSTGLFPTASVYKGVILHDGQSNKAFYSNGTNYSKVIDSDTLTTGSYNITTNATLNSLALNRPKMNTIIRDSADNEIIQLTSSGTPNNYLKVTAEASTASPTIGADGADTDVGIKIAPKNSGVIEVGGRIKYSTQTLDSSGAAFDSDKAMYIINVSTTTSYNFFNTGFDAGEIKKIVNKSGGNEVTLQVGSTFLGHPDAGTGNIVLTGNAFFEMVFDGDRWNLDRDSDRHVAIT